MSPSRLRRALCVALVAGASVLAAAPPAVADKPLAVAWWWLGGIGGTNATLAASAAKPPVPKGGLFVGGTMAGSTAVGAVRYRVAPTLMASRLTFEVADLAGLPVVGICPSTLAWTSVESGAWSQRPTFDCSRSARGSFSEDMSTLSFDASKVMRDDFLDVMVLPGLDANGAAASFELTLNPPSNRSLSTRPRPALASSSAPAPPSQDEPAFPTADSFVPAPITEAPPVDADSSLDAVEERFATISDGAPQAFPVSSPGAGVDYGRLALWLALGAAAVVAVRARRAYTPNGTVLDFVVGVRPLSGFKVSARFDRLWRVALGVAAAAIVWAGAARQLPNGVPVGVVLYGAIIGSLAGLVSLGLVLVYRANRIISFGQAAFGQVALILTFELAFNWKWPYVLAAAAGLVLAVGLSAGAELGIMRRFRHAPRLIVTLATIGIANILLFGMLIIIVLFERDATVTAAGTVGYPSPLPQTAFVLSGIVFSWDAVVAMIVAPVVVVLLARFLARSWWGIGIRAAAENADRAGTLAVPVGRLSTVTWMLAGGLAALGTILRAPVGGYSLQNLTGTGFLAIMLTAAVIGRLESLTWTFVGAIAIGIADQVFFYSFSKGAPLDGLHLAMILLAFLLFPLVTSRSRWQEVSSWRSFREVRPTPAELASLPVVRAVRRFGPLVLVAIVSALPLVVRDISSIRLMSVMGVWAIAALSLVVLTGWAGHVSLGQWAIVGCGAFAAGRVVTGVSGASPVLVLIVSALVGGGVAAILGIPAIRLRPIYLAIVTFAFATAAWGWMFGWEWVQPTGDIGRPSWLRTETAAYQLVLASLVVAVVVTTNLRRSRFGRILVASRDNAAATQSYGVNLFRARATAFIVSGFIAGAAGGLYALVNQAADFRDFTPARSLYLFAIAVIGGLGSIPGAVLGAVYIVGAQYFLPEWGPFLATGIGMLLFLLVFPGGLGQIVYDGRDRILRRIAQREGIVSPSLLADLRVPEAAVITAADTASKAPPRIRALAGGK